ncbi:hypothetical protein JW796_04690 [Candidatus Dojkabacteria bacterium]|nr:hypothetical protein [Candidatus Dojkabacteria bacterium]
MRKIIFFIISFLVLFSAGFTLSSRVHAEQIPNPIGDSDLIGLISRLTGLVRPIAIIALIGVIIYGGFTRLTAAGEPEKEKKSMQILTAGIVGFLIIVLASVIVSFIGDILGVPDIIDVTTP